MIEQNLIKSKSVKTLKYAYFGHYKTKEENICSTYNDYILSPFSKNIEELSKNDWELHKKLIKEGINPNEIAKIFRYDEIEKLQKFSSQSDFDFNQVIESSIYEKCSFINRAYIPLIDYSAFFGSIKCFKYLLLNNANINSAGKYAVASGNLEIIHLCEQNHSTFKGAYKTAIMFHQNDILKYIFENKLEKINNLKKLGVKCILYHNREIFDYLHGVGLENYSDFLVVSEKIGNIFLSKYFYNKNLFYEFYFPAKSGNIELVKYILRQKYVDVNDINERNGKTALIYASKNGHTEIVKLLLKQKGINVNVKDFYEDTALMCASHYNHAKIVKLLLEQEGIDINAQDNDGYTALMFASRYGCIKIVKLLLEQKGIKVNKEDDNRGTALKFASYYGYIDIVKLLLSQKGIKVNSKNKGLTALMLASQNGHIETVNALLKHKEIDINYQDEDGQTALMVASSNGYTEIVKLLLEQEGIDINANDNININNLIL